MASPNVNQANTNMTLMTLPIQPQAKQSAAAVPNAAVVEASVGMGQIALLSPVGVGRAVLGSCVGLVLYEPNRRFAAMAHIVLPTSESRAGTPGKFVDTALLAMVDQLRGCGIEPKHLIAKMSGGASMFDSKGPFQIGQENVKAVHCQISQLKIRLVGEHVGGTRGRRIVFDCQSGEMLVEVLGSTPVTL